MHPYNLGDLTFGGLFADGEALIDFRPGGRSWTYQTLETMCSAASDRLLSLGCRRGDKVAIIGENSVEFLAYYFGAMRAGLVAVPLNFKLPAATIGLLLNDCDPKVVVVDISLQHLAGDERTLVDLAEWAKPVEPAICRPSVRPEPGEVAEILYTSGSTGRPKGVPLSHDGQLWAISSYQQPDPQPGETTIVAAPMYHMNALFNIYISLINRVRIILMPRFEARAWITAISQFQCTILSGIPSMYALALRERDLIQSSTFSFVKRISVGSSPLTSSLTEQIRCVFPEAELTNSYGTTEAGPAVFGDHPDGLPRPALSVGYPLPSIGLRLAGAVPDEGILEIRTAAQMVEYHNLPIASAEKLRDGWYITGDIMRRDPNGFYFFVGRVDDMFVCGGENLYPGEIEKLVECHPAVMQAAVVAVPDAIKGHIPIAFVVPIPGQAVDPRTLKNFTLSHGPAYAHPRAFFIVETLPTAGTHKVDKQKLYQLALDLSRDLKRN